mgnify:CR=1 FL=1
MNRPCMENQTGDRGENRFPAFPVESGLMEEHMNVESLINTQGTGQFQLSKGADQVTEARKQKADADVSDSARQQIQPEELLQQINALTEEGMYSVRFENDKQAGELVVKIVDPETDEVIRQIPPEELINLTQRMNDLRGNLLKAEG